MDSDPRNATIVLREDVSEHLSVLRVQPDLGEVPVFEPGQFAMLGLPRPVPVRAGDSGTAVGARPGMRMRMVRRAYSIASSARERAWAEFCLVRVPQGKLTEPLWEIGEGGRVWMDEEIRGEFTLDLAPLRADLVLVATGTGIGPFMSMLRTYRDQGRGRDRWRRLVLIHGVRRARDLVYREELERASAQDGSIAYLPVVSREPEESGWSGLRGRVQQVLEGETWQRLLADPLDPERAHVFLCGNPDMIRSVSAILVERSFRPSSRGQSGNLHYERYW